MNTQDKLANALRNLCAEMASVAKERGVSRDQVNTYRWCKRRIMAIVADHLTKTHPQSSQGAQDAEGCVWSEDEEGNWDTGCGHMFVINEGTPYDNEMGFCCYCGGKLDQVTQAEAAMAKESGR